MHWRAYHIAKNCVIVITWIGGVSTGIRQCGRDILCYIASIAKGGPVRRWGTMVLGVSHHKDTSDLNCYSSNLEDSHTLPQYWDRQDEREGSHGHIHRRIGCHTARKTGDAAKECQF